MCVTSSGGAELDRVGPAIGIHEDAVIVIGIPTGHAGDGLALLHVEGEGADLVRRDRCRNRVAGAVEAVVETRLLERLDALCEIQHRDEFGVLFIGIAQELGVHLLRIGEMAPSLTTHWVGP